MRFSSRTLPAGAALVCVVLVCAALPSPAAAHHSFPAFFDTTATREIQGRLTRIHWANPHIKLYVLASDGQTWEVEAGPVVQLEDIGIRRDMLRIGKDIHVFGNPGRRGARTLWASNILLLPERTELLFTAGAQPYGPWKASTSVGDSKRFVEPTELATDPDRGLFRIWSTIIPNDFPKRRREPFLTDAGRRAQARYEKKVIDDCDVPGMPFAMVSPYKIEIVKEGDRLLIRGEAYDLRRVVHLAAPARPPAPSPLGLSVGRIAGDELIVRTSRINYHSYGDLGPAQSAQSFVVERFTLSADRLHLDYEITIFDPVMLREPWSWGGKFFAEKDAAMVIWNCGVDRGQTQARATR